MTVLPESSKDGKVRALSEFENQNYFLILWKLKYRNTSSCLLEPDNFKLMQKDEVCLRIAWAFLSCIKGFVRTSTAAGIAHAFLSAKMNDHSDAL